jgi:hypothetical protein
MGGPAGGLVGGLVGGIVAGIMATGVVFVIGTRGIVFGTRGIVSVASSTFSKYFAVSPLLPSSSSELQLLDSEQLCT